MALEEITSAHAPLAGSTKSADRWIWQQSSLSSAAIIFMKKAYLKEFIGSRILYFLRNKSKAMPVTGGGSP
jgi:hypothetical protein